MVVSSHTTVQYLVHCILDFFAVRGCYRF